MNTAEKARLAHEKAKTEKEAAKEKRKEILKRTLVISLVIGSAVAFILEAIGASGSSFAAITMQKITFYISIGFFLADAAIVFIFPNRLLEINNFTKFFRIAAALLGIATFVMGCVTIGSGRLAFEVKSSFYDEQYGVLYVELDNGFTVWEIDPNEENVLILAKHDGVAVTGVSKDAARNNSKIKTLTFAPNGSYELENTAFRDSSLTAISFGDNSHFTFHDEVFANCRRLATVNCGSRSTLTFEGKNSFKDCLALSEFHVNDSKLVINTTLDIDCDKTLFGEETNAVIYVNGGDTSYIADNVGGIVVGKNSSVTLAHYSYGGWPNCPVHVGTYRFEEGFDFDGSTLFTMELQNYVLVQQRNYLPLADEIYLPTSVTYIPDNFFGDKGDGCKVYYAGSAEDWEKLSIGENGNENYNNGKITMIYDYAE